MKLKIMLLPLVLIAACTSNRDQKSDSGVGKPIVTTVNYPLFYFADRIAGEYIELEFPIPTDVDPAYWMPDDTALSIFQEADLILTNGADYAKWMNHVSLPSSRIVNTSAAAKTKYIELKQGQSHSHGAEGEHEHSGYAFTTWLDFEFAVIQAESAKEALLKLLPEKKVEIEKSFIALKEKLLMLHKQMREISDLIGEQNLVGSHPVYQYLAKAYNLKIHSVHFEPVEIPTTQQWKEFDHLLEHHPAKIMLWEDEPIQEITEVLNTKGIKVIVFNPCGNKPGPSEFMEVMNLNVTNFKKEALFQ